MPARLTDEDGEIDVETVADLLGDLDVDELRSRLASLGVVIGSGASNAGGTRVFEASGIAEGDSDSSNSSLRLMDSDDQRIEDLTERRAQQRKEILNLLSKCNKVEKALNETEAGLRAAEDANALQQSASTIKTLIKQTYSPAKKAPSPSHRAKPAAPAAPRQPARPAPAQRAKQAMPPPPPRSPARKAPPAGPADDAGAGPSKQTLRLLQAEMKEMRDLHAAEKGALRRESEQHRKRALGLQRELERAQVQLQSRTSDVTALKAALRTREERVQSAERRAVETEEAALRARQATVEKLCAAEAERDELKTLLLATLKRLESVEEAVQRSDVAAAVMTEKLRTLEFEREKALNVAAASREEASMLTQAHRRLESELDMLRRLQAQATTRNAARKGALRAALNDQSGARDRLRRAMDALGCESGSDDACACGDESSSDCSPLVGRGGLASRMPPALRVRP